MVWKLLSDLLSDFTTFSHRVAIDITFSIEFSYGLYRRNLSHHRSRTSRLRSHESKLYLSNSLDQLSGTAKQAYICKTPLEKIKRATRGAAWRRPRAGFRDFLSMKGQCSRSSPDRSCSESFRCTNTAVGWSKREEKSSDAASIKALLTHQ